ESETGSAFLSQLLFTASKEISKVARKRKTLACTHFISFANQSLYTEITLPDVCFFELTKEQLKTSRIELAIFEGDEQIASLGTGYVQFEQNKTSVPMRNSSAQVYRSHAGSELYLAAMQAGCKLAEIRLSSSAIDIGESPLSLVECDDKWQILSQSSLKTKHAQVGVLCPTNATIILVYGELSDSDLSFAGLTFKLLNGQCELILSQHDRYIITTSSDDFESASYVLHGEQLQWKTSPSLVFKGVPSVRCENQLEDSGYRENVSIYLGNSAIGLLSPSELYGRQLVVAKTADGVIQLRKRVGILPKDFDIELVNGNEPNQCVIRVKTASPCVWSVIPDRLEVIKSTKKLGEKEIWVRAIGKPPATIAIAVRANILSEHIVIEVPFPARGAMAYHHDGKPLAKRLTVNDLLGSRLHLFSTQGIPANFKVEAVVRKLGHGNSKQPFYRWDYRVTDKTVEVSLYGLKDAILELLSLSEMLDGEVELSITGPGKPLTFTINHYSTILEHDRINNTLALRSTASLNANDVKPVLMSLSDPVQKPHMLVARKSEGVNTGEYELPAFIEQDGPWLVIPQRASEVSFRAKYFAGSNSYLNDEEVKTLQKAAQLYHPQNNPEVIANVLKQMSLDWSHSGWTYLKDTYKNFGYLPLSTFEVWRHLVRDERALAVAVFHFENDAKFISRVESEFPIVWEMISIKCWLHAADLMRNALHGFGISDDILTPMIKVAIEKLGRAVPALAETVVNWLVEGRIPAGMPVDLVKGMSELWYQDLLRTHSEDNQWPIEYGEDLKQCCTKLNLLPFDLNINVNYQAGVVYLPLFVAAVALDFVPEAISKQLPKDAIFHLRKLRDFDRDWFEPMYRCFIAYFANQSN
ncbi:MAG: STY4851/ECs_5259 family protein, partial [Shewanella sp.]